MLQKTSVKKSAFTLIELSIALVIIALVVSGIMFGSEIIATARTRAILAEKQDFESKVVAFKLKYTYLPGDMPLSKQAGFGFTAAGCPGITALDNGAIDGMYSGTYFLTCESNWAAEQLMLAGFYGTGDVTLFGSYGYVIRSKTLNNRMWAPMSWQYAGIGGNYLVLQGGTWHFGGGNSFAGDQHAIGLSSAASKRIDAKIDDGLPLSGTMQMVGYSNATGCSDKFSVLGSCPGHLGYTAPGNACASATSYYNSEEESNSFGSTGGCKIAFKMNY